MIAGHRPFDRQPERGAPHAFLERIGGAIVAAIEAGGRDVFGLGWRLSPRRQGVERRSEAEGQRRESTAARAAREGSGEEAGEDLGGHISQSTRAPPELLTS